MKMQRSSRRGLSWAVRSSSSDKEPRAGEIRRPSLFTRTVTKLHLPTWGSMSASKSSKHSSICSIKPQGLTFTTRATRSRPRKDPATPTSLRSAPVLQRDRGLFYFLHTTNYVFVFQKRDGHSPETSDERVHPHAILHFCSLVSGRSPKAQLACGFTQNCL